MNQCCLCSFSKLFYISIYFPSLLQVGAEANRKEEAVLLTWEELKEKQEKRASGFTGKGARRVVPTEIMLPRECSLCFA